MRSYTYYFWTFMLGAFLGVVIETTWCFLRYKKIESRKGLIFGPFNALYGVATVALSLFINLSSNKSLGNYFLIGVVVSSVIEYLCSYYQEKIVGTISWDYKSFKYNLNGRINLVYSLFWGILTIGWAVIFMPGLEDITLFFEMHVLLTIIMSIFMAANCFISLAACIRRRQRRENVDARTRLDKHLDERYTDEVLDKIYANSKFVDETE